MRLEVHGIGLVVVLNLWVVTPLGVTLDNIAFMAIKAILSEVMAS